MGGERVGGCALGLEGLTEDGVCQGAGAGGSRQARDSASEEWGSAEKRKVKTRE